GPAAWRPASSWSRPSASPPRNRRRPSFTRVRRPSRPSRSPSKSYGGCSRRPKPQRETAWTSRHFRVLFQLDPSQAGWPRQTARNTPSLLPRPRVEPFHGSLLLRSFAMSEVDHNREAAVLLERIAAAIRDELGTEIEAYPGAFSPERADPMNRAI